ncbi:MAG: hypothetical protein ACRDD1_00140 [Planctomycetia bacterium]
MFTPADIRERLRKTPFTPVRFVTTTGAAYDIQHPDMVIVGKTFLIVGLPTPEDSSVAERSTLIALLHVVQMQDLSSPMLQPSGGDAQAG